MENRIEEKREKRIEVKKSEEEVREQKRCKDLLT